MSKHDERKQRLLASIPTLDTDEEPQFPQVKLKRDMSTIWLVLSFVFCALLVVFHLNFMVAKVDGPSMNNTLENGETLLIHKGEKAKRFDIVVLNEREVKDGPEKKIIKRVIGMPNDTVTVIDGKLYINNTRYKENYLSKKNVQNFKKVNWTIHVPKNHYFVLGDNRDISKDSRIVGSFDKSAIVGVKVLGTEHAPK